MSQLGEYTQVSKLVGIGAIGSAIQGCSVKLSEDGNFLFIGGYADNNYIGAVWFYQKVNGVWTEKQKIVPTGYIGTPLFGYSITVNPSMDTLIVGAVYDNGDVGALFVLTFDGTTWTQQAKLVGTGVSGSQQSAQGFSVALSADTDTAIVGGPYDENNVGAAWIFLRAGNAWSQQGSKLVGSDYSGQSRQGWSVALTSNGNLAVVGAYGAIWVYLRSNTSWNQVGTKITVGYFGLALALSGDDQTLVVGGYADNNYAGAAWIFKRIGNTFTQFGNKLVGTGATSSAQQGWSVAVNKLGTLVSVGASGDSSSVGAIFMYYFNGTNYNQLGNKIVAADAIGTAKQGQSVALDASGTQLLFGGYYDNANLGAAWIYANTAITSSPSATPTTQPSVGPTTQPSYIPTTQPSYIPTTQPSVAPTTQPSVNPTTQPSVGPTTQPSVEPMLLPSFAPSFKPTAIATTKPTSALSSTSSGAFLSLVTVIPVLLCTLCALMYFFFRVYKKQVNREGEEMKTWIEGNKGEIALHGNNLCDKSNDDEGLEVAPMDNPLQRPPSTRAISLNI